MLETSATSSTTISSALRLSANSRHANASFFASISFRESCSGVLKVKSRVAYGFGDGGGNEVLNRLACADALANLGRRHPKWKPAEGPHPESGRRTGSRFAGTRN